MLRFSLHPLGSIILKNLPFAIHILSFNYFYLIGIKKKEHLQNN